MTIKRITTGNPDISGQDENDYFGYGPGLSKDAQRVQYATIPVEDILFRYLDTNGDGTGDVNGNGNYSSSATEFKITTPANEIYELHRMLVQIRDSGALSADDYGNVAELSNGVSVYVKNASGDIVNTLTDTITVKSNSDWSRQCYDVNVDDYGNGNNFVSVRWTFANTGSRLRLPAGYSFNVLLNDNLSGLVSHYFQVQGFTIRNY